MKFAMTNLQCAKNLPLAMRNEAATNCQSRIANLLPIAHSQLLIPVAGVDS